MKNRLLLATALTALSFSAFAADLPARTAAPYAPAPIFSWTGFYVGGNVGYISAKTATTDVDYTGDTVQSTGSGVLGGIQAGYNYQVGAIVFGLEADLAATSAKPNASTYGGDRLDRHTISALGTVRGRVGYAVDRTLIYVTGGLAYANVKNAGTASIGGGSSPITLSAETSGWRTGYAVGGGIETAIDKNWTVKFEGLYYNVGHSQVEVSGYRFKSKNDGALARVGVNFKF